MSVVFSMTDGLKLVLAATYLKYLSSFLREDELEGPRGPVVSTLRLISLLRVGEWIKFPWSSGRCTSLSCCKNFLSLSCTWRCSLLFRRGFIRGLLCQAHKSDWFGVCYLLNIQTLESIIASVQKIFLPIVHSYCSLISILSLYSQPWACFLSIVMLAIEWVQCKLLVSKLSL